MEKGYVRRDKAYYDRREKEEKEYGRKLWLFLLVATVCIVAVFGGLVALMAWFGKELSFATYVGLSVMAVVLTVVHLVKHGPDLPKFFGPRRNQARGN